jgi:formiminotetrahydrofolate cyclodeaminase
MFDPSTPIRDFLNAAAAKKPTPGGGSVTALVGALAASMGEMTLNYSIGKKGLEAYQDELKPALAQLARAREMLLQLMVEDQLAFEALSAAKKLPEGSKERDEKLPAALLTCVRIPQAIAATGVAILERCDEIVNFVNYYLLSDLAVCADLSMASIRCAVYNVRTNLKDIPDAADRAHLEDDVRKILNRALSLIQSVTPRIWAREKQGA